MNTNVCINGMCKYTSQCKFPTHKTGVIRCPIYLGTFFLITVNNRVGLWREGWAAALNRQTSSKGEREAGALIMVYKSGSQM